MKERIVPQSMVAVRRDGDGFQVHRQKDAVAKEEPLEIRIEHRGTNLPFAVTMRTPGDDVALTAGFLFTDGVVDRAEDLLEVRPCKTPGAGQEPVANITQVLLAPDHPFDLERMRRNVYTTSSCGVCGKASIDAVAVACRPIGPVSMGVAPAVLASLPGLVRAHQEAFAETGGLHATALVRFDGSIEDVREDVGRHNAMDKVVGAALLGHRLPFTGRILMVSGRASFELVQKAARAGAPVLAAIGAPSSLALEAAERLGVTVIGFLRNDRFNIYTHPERIDGTIAAMEP